MFICIDKFRWVLNANAPLLMLIFHGDHWLHLLVFRQETTTKNLQLLQTWVTNTLSCVWLWWADAFLAEEMKRQQAATRKHHARPAAPTSPRLHRLRGAQQLPCVAQPSQQAIKVILCSHSPESALWTSPSGSGQARGHRSPAAYASGWLVKAEARHQ